MEVSTSFTLSVREPSQVAEARRLAERAARTSGLDATDAGKVAIVVTEIATNLVKHAQEGELLLRALGGGQPGGGIEVLGLDRGPGMADIERHVRDGFSTTGSPGTGLGAIRRLATSCDIYSCPGQGTAVMARVWAGGRTRDGSPLEIGVAGAAKPGEEVSGDGWAVRAWPDRVLLLVVDGLGHGPAAATAAAAARRAFETDRADGPGTILETVHAALRATRGAAVAIAEVRPRERLVRFAGLGNIAGGLRTADGHRNFVSMNGIAGHMARKVQEFSYPWVADAVLVLHSDGLDSKWNLDRYPGLATRHPSIAAGILYRDFTRGRDDVTVVVARENGA